MSDETARPDHLKSLHVQLYAAGFKTRDAKLALISQALGREVSTSKTLTTGEVNQVARLAAERSAA